MRPLIESLPGYYQNSAPVAELERAIGTQMEALWEDREDLLRQLWVDTATWGLAWWESWCGLPVDTTLSHEARRARVKAKLRGRGTTTQEVVRGIAQSYSPYPVEVTEQPERYHFVLWFSGTAGEVARKADLTSAINEVKPAHLGWEIKYRMICAAPVFAAGVYRTAERIILRQEA